jgi:iron(III) transport system permease protein
MCENKARARRSWGLYATMAGLYAFLGVFLIWPIFYVFHQSVWINGRFDLSFFRLMLLDESLRQSIGNSFKIAVLVTFFTTLISLPFAVALARLRFRGKSLLQGLLLVPLIMPPFVGAIGLRTILSRSGSLNTLMVDVLKIWSQPMDWFEYGLVGVVLLEILHLYPIMLLNLTAAIANIDPAMEEAASNLGAGRWRRFWSVTFPLMRPGYFAGSVIVFIWAFTDLGTPLMFDYRRVVPVQIFDRVKDVNTNPMGYAIVVFVVILTAVIFGLSRWVMGGRHEGMMSRGHTSSAERAARGWEQTLLWVGGGLLIAVALVPHLGVIMSSISRPGSWFMTVLPQEWTLDHYRAVFDRPDTMGSIQNSLLYASLSTVLDIVIGVLIAWLLVRKKVPTGAVLDTLAMMPLALPGVVLAFGYVATFAGTFLDPRRDPTALLVIGYAVRRLPYMIRSAYAGFQQTSITLEEASANMGAGPFRTLWRITLPLVAANLLAGAVLAFSFAMLEVSDSLILAMQPRFYPIAKQIFSLYLRLGDGENIASAMGMLGMFLLTVSLLVAAKTLGKRMGQLFQS